MKILISMPMHHCARNIVETHILYTKLNDIINGYHIGSGKGNRNKLQT